MNCCKGEGGGLLELGAQWIHGGSEENSVWREAKRASLLGEVDEDEVGRLVDVYFHLHHHPPIGGQGGRCRREQGG